MLAACAAPARAGLSLAQPQPITSLPTLRAPVASRFIPAASASNFLSSSSPVSSSSSSAGRQQQRRWRRRAEGGTGPTVAEAEQPAASSSASSSKSVPQSDVWELDFCSRPILDERGKKVRKREAADMQGPSHAVRHRRLIACSTVGCL